MSANRLADGNDAVGTSRQVTVEPWGDRPDAAAWQAERIRGQLAGQQGMGIVHDRGPPERVGRDEQALIVVRMDEVEADLAMQAAQQPGEHRVELEELADRGSGIGTTIGGNVTDPMDDEGRVGQILAQVVGHDVHRVSPARHGFGDAVNPDGGAARPGKRAGRDHGDAKGVSHPGARSRSRAAAPVPGPSAGGGPRSGRRRRSTTRRRRSGMRP